MNRTTINRFYNLLRAHVGVSLDESKDYLLQSRLHTISQSYNFNNVHSFVEHLVQNPIGVRHWEAFIALTTNETHFFRDRHFFNGLKDYVFPKLIALRSGRKCLNVWSAASSTGQEAYSVALLLRENFPELCGWNINIFGTDVSPLNIQKASAGLYNETESERGLNTQLLAKYFDKRENGFYEIKDCIKSNVNFSCLNLVGAWPTLPRFDLILLRNVMIYFDQETRENILKRMQSHLLPNGVLILGATETILGNQHYDLNQYGRFVFFSPKP